jgi:cysteine synthase B
MIITESETLKQKINQLQPFIGNTPLFPITGLHENENVKIYAKLEWNQLTNSVKARAASIL